MLSGTQYSAEVQQCPLATASEHNQQQTELAGTTAKRAAVPLVRDEEGPWPRTVGGSAAKKQASGLSHRGLEARLPNIDIRHAQGVALLT